MAITTRENDIKSIIFTEQQIADIIQDLAKTLVRDYGDKRPLLVCVLKGAAPFFVDLCRAMDCHLDMDFISVSSYGMSRQSTGTVKFKKDVDADLTGRDVLLIDDIVDSGLTLRYLKNLFATRGARSVKTVALLDKEACHTPEETPDYAGTLCPNEFVVGYGLDYAESYRNLPFIGVLKEEVYQA